MKNCRWIILFFLFCNNVMAIPTGEDLLEACEFSQKNGFQSKQGMMCIWYVTPCDCNFGNKKSIPRVCLPREISHELLADEVITGLKEKPELMQETADMAVGKILSPRYPCSD